MLDVVQCLLSIKADNVRYISVIIVLCPIYITFAIIQCLIHISYYNTMSHVYQLSYTMSDTYQLL